MTDEIKDMIRELRADVAKGIHGINHRLDLLEHKYHEAVETLPVMKGINDKLAVILNHMEEGGNKANLLKQIKH